MMDAQTEDTKMLNALDEFLADNADDAAVSAVSCDPSGKARPVYSTGIMSYEDSTALIWDHTERLFDYSQNVDPHSEQYLKICKLLQRAVSHLGRAVITRAAMQQKDRRLPKLGGLTAGRLMEIVSGSLRICDGAMREYERIHHEPDIRLFNELLSFSNTADRLRATHWKAIQLENYDINGMNIRGRAQSLDSEYLPKKKDAAKNNEPVSFRSAPAFEIRRDVIAAADSEDAKTPRRTPIETGELRPTVTEECLESNGGMPREKQKTPREICSPDGNEPEPIAQMFTGGQERETEKQQSGSPVTETLMLPAPKPEKPGNEALKPEAGKPEETKPEWSDEEEKKFRKWVEGLPSKEEIYESMSEEEIELLKNAQENPELMNAIINYCNHPELLEEDPEALAICRKIVLYLTG